MGLWCVLWCVLWWWGCGFSPCTVDPVLTEGEPSTAPPEASLAPSAERGLPQPTKESMARAAKGPHVGKEMFVRQWLLLFVRQGLQPERSVLGEWGGAC